jgi:hypothetical protein
MSIKSFVSVVTIPMQNKIFRINNLVIIIHILFPDKLYELNEIDDSIYN